MIRIRKPLKKSSKQHSYKAKEDHHRHHSCRALWAAPRNCSNKGDWRWWGSLLLWILLLLLLKEKLNHFFLVVADWCVWTNPLFLALVSLPVGYTKGVHVLIWYGLFLSRWRRAAVPAGPGQDQDRLRVQLRAVLKRKSCGRSIWFLAHPEALTAVDWLRDCIIFFNYA